jgi:glycine cleavage system regulatory protein
LDFGFSIFDWESGRLEDSVSGLRPDGDQDRSSKIRNRKSKMNASLVMTVIGPDRPGLVQAVAACVADHGGNWLESRMCHLGGQFAGLLRVEVDAGRRDGLVRALQALEASGLRVIVHAEAGPAPAGQGVVARLELVGQDRPGILRSISAVLAAHGVNVEELASERESAPMGGGTLFKARATVLVPAGVNQAKVRAELEKIAADLMVDLTLGPA